MNNAGVNLRTGAEVAWTNFMNFVPNFVLFLVILVVGYFVAKVVAQVLDKVLQRLGFDRLVERGGIKRAFERTKWTASDVVGAVIFWTIFLFVLQLAFGVFGPNPISAIITAVIAFLPSIFAALLIVIIASAVAAAAKQILQATMGGLSYGRAVANVVSAAIMVIGIFMALDQLGIAPAIVNGLFYAVLAIVVGSAIISIGCGGIAPMRAEWERGLARLHAEAPKIKAAAANAPQQTQAQAEDWKQVAVASSAEHSDMPERPRFPTQP
jgi:hypothetical protein